MAADLTTIYRQVSRLVLDYCSTLLSSHRPAILLSTLAATTLILLSSLLLLLGALLRKVKS